MRETLLALPSPVPPATHLRGAVIVNSQAEARLRGLEPRYWDSLPEAHHAELREVIAASWVPMDLAVAHYLAMDALALAREDIVRLGGAAGDRLQKSFLGTLVRSLRASGAVAPLALLGRLDRVVGRAVLGGGVRAVRTGPKDALVEHHGMPIADIPYVRAGWEGMYRAGLALVSRSGYVRELTPPGPECAAFALSWV